MDYEAIAGPFQDTAVDRLTTQDGVIDILPKLSMSFTDDSQIIKNLNSRIEDSVNYWDDIQGQNLKYARAQSERMVIGKQIDTSKLYRYQIPYIDNEIHVAIDTTISYVTAQTPSPEVYPAQDTEMSKILAKDLEKAMNAYCDAEEIGSVFEQALYGVLVKRLGVIKVWYDPERDEICTKAINPDWFGVDKNARMGENPNFTWEIHKDIAEEVVRMFPKKKNQIFERLGGGKGIKYGTAKQMTEEVVWREVHATVYDEGKLQEVVFCYMKDLMLAKYKDPNWLYNQDEGKLKNFLDLPMKPYIPMNYLNDGSHWIDQTTPIEQAYSMQDVLNKRGRQIMENADTANGFLAVSSESVNMDEAENLIGDPNQKIVIDTGGRPITEHITQIQPHMLPSFVIEDKTDIKTTLHNIMGTPAQLSGTNEKNTNTDTLGEAMMIKNQASGRQDRLARAVERCAKQYFNFLAQMFRVHYTTKHWKVYNSGDGNFDHVVMQRHMVEPGALVTVRAGTTLPFDKARQEATALNLAKMGLISPIDLYKDLHMDNPQQRFNNWVKFKSDPQALATDVDNQTQDGQAYVEFVEIMNGKKDVKPFEEATEEHILAHRKQMITDQFLKAKRPYQNALLDLVEEELQSLTTRLQLEGMSTPQAPPIGAPGAPESPPQAPPGAPMGGPPPGPMGPPPVGPPGLGGPKARPEGPVGPLSQQPMNPAPPIANIMQPQAPPHMQMQNPMQLPTV